MPDADKNATLAFVEVLAGLVSQKSFPLFVRGLVEGSPRVVAGIAWALTSSRNYPANLLIEALGTPGVSKSALLEVIAAQKSRFGVRELLNAAYTQEPNEKAALFRIIGEIADASAVPELIGRVQGKDPIARVHIINILARFNTPEVQTALQGLLKDPNKLIRGATLSALQRMDGKIDIERVCALLKDPEIDVQNKAIDVVIKANDPETIRYLIEILKDENENARRAAVEVLNEVGNAKSVKHLLEALKDSDWWVRSRAADALGKIGGPRVIDAVLQLIRDKDEDIRRAAIEILNQTKDERAVDSLIQATRDPDWWVSERAVDALAEIGSKRAVPRLTEMLKARAGQGDPDRRPRPGEARRCAAGRHPAALHGAGRSGSSGSRRCRRCPRSSTSGAPSSCARSCSHRRSPPIRPSPGWRARHLPSSTTAWPAGPAGTGGTPLPAPPAVARPPLPAPPIAVDARVRQVDAAGQSRIAEGPPRLDIGTLKPGDIIEGRYKYIDRIGRGAFGTVLLMEDTVVDERLILKFLNPNVSGDEEVMKRFVHELRYSRKITHKNVIRIYDFLYIQGNYAISMEYFPSHTLGSEIVEREADRAQAGAAVRLRHLHRHDGGAPGRHRAPRPEAGQRAHQSGGTAQDRGLRRRRRAARGRHPAHQDRVRHRLAEVHGARADPRQEGRRACRHLRPRA